ncbi:MAG: hypothetical protein KTU85_10760 [Acidimicrobiia bacterium]|nr:hypothetical protein [Acidimicrobiia bacterium]
MIMPTKGVPPQRALLTVGGEIVEILDENKTVSGAWAELRRRREARADAEIAFDWFVLALDLVFALGAVELGEDGFLVRVIR